MSNPSRHFRTPFPILLLAVFAGAAAWPAAWADEGSGPANPFLPFVGKYELILDECSVNAKPAGGCSLLAVEVKQRRDGSLHIIEISADRSEDYPLYEASETQQEGGLLKATITGSPGNATWEYLRVYSDGSEHAAIKLFLQYEGDTLYHSYHRERDVDGIDFVMKQTYKVVPSFLMPAASFFSSRFQTSARARSG